MLIEEFYSKNRKVVYLKFAGQLTLQLKQTLNKLKHFIIYKRIQCISSIKLCDARMMK